MDVANDKIDKVQLVAMRLSVTNVERLAMVTMPW
jgi:hypothetical protein